MSSRHKNVDGFYELLDSLAERVGSYRYLSQCNGNMGWPKRGLYFFFENGEFRKNSSDLRVVRVGTHAVSKGSKTTLWNRLRTHRGSLKGIRPGGGNHRGSIFRLHVGTSILNKTGSRDEYKTWSKGSSAKSPIRVKEYPIEKRVSNHIGSMPLLWLDVDDPAGKNSERTYLEKNSISLLSNYRMLSLDSAIDPPSSMWLGTYCSNDFVRKSGLWNVNHVKKPDVDQGFLEKLEYRINKM